MPIFGGKRIAELEQELESLQAQLEQTQRERAEAEHARHEAEASLRYANERIEGYAARLDRLAEGTRSPTRAVPVPPPEREPKWELVEPGDDPNDSEDSRVRAHYTIEGAPRHLQALELMFKMIATAGDVGATVFFDVMVDGDGAARIEVSRGDHVLELSDAEQSAWFRGEGELPEGSEVRDATRRDGLVCVELV